ncbi:MAG: peptidoglycan-binding protein [Sphingomonadales bacterium]|nr:peptidoglycan-binding protein [Sphingomonadales bacterium]
MTEQSLKKAKLIELKEDLTSELSGGKSIDVQFNPDTLKVTYANQVVQPEGGNQAAGTSGRQFVGAGTTKLALTLWFDVTAMTENAVDDVRRLTKDVIHFMTPKASEQDSTKLVPPGTRFSWGSFIFDGMVEGLEESLEFFSPEGKPLRASITLTLSQQKILVSTFEGSGAVSRAGARPFASAKQGDSVQSMAATSGKGGDWQGIASANGIEDPLRMDAGQFVDLNASVGATVSASASLSIGASAATSISAVVSSPPTISLGSVPAPPALPQLGFN